MVGEQCQFQNVLAMMALVLLALHLALERGILLLLRLNLPLSVQLDLLKLLLRHGLLLTLWTLIWLLSLLLGLRLVGLSLRRLLLLTLSALLSIRLGILWRGWLALLVGTRLRPHCRTSGLWLTGRLIRLRRLTTLVAMLLLHGHLLLRHLLVLSGGLPLQMQLLLLQH